MKRILVRCTAAILMLSLFTGCSAKTAPSDAEATSVLNVLNADMLSIYENRSASLPAAVIYLFQGNGVRVESPLYGADAVNAVLDAIAEITIAGETERTVADSDSSYVFLNADGTEAGRVSFNGSFLDLGDKKYEVEKKKALAAIDFPAETNRDMLAIDGPDPRMYEFLEKCKTEEPASVKVVRDGSEYEITEPDTIREAADALYSIGFVWYALQGAEPPSTTLTATFVMNDGWDYSLTFDDNSVYVYEYPEPLGAWSFYTDGAEHFIQILEKDK